MREQAFQPVHPYNSHRLWGDEKYNLQNMLLCEVNMPTSHYEGEQIFDIWDDRISTIWYEMRDKFLDSKGSGCSMYALASEKSILEFASAVFSKVEGRPIKLTGCAIVRFTNEMSGYATLRLTGIIATERLAGRKYGVPKIQPEQVVNRFGRFEEAY